MKARVHAERPSLKTRPAAAPAGRAVVRRFVTAPRPQPMLTMGATNDAFEREADQVAARVMRMPEPVIQRACAACQKEADDERVVRRLGAERLDTVEEKREGGAPPEVPAGFAGQFASLQAGGRPLPASERAFFEPRFGRDFSAVRLHTGPAASELARSIHARAFTLGNSIVLASGEGGRPLLAHELTHVVQQTAGGPHGPQRSPDEGRWSRSEAAARYRGQVMARRILNHGRLSNDAKQKMQRELAYFEGAAWEAYVRQVRPALLAVTEIEMPAESVAPVPAPQPPVTAPPAPTPPPVCVPPPAQSSPGKHCKFYIYDSTEPTGFAWKWKTAAFALAAFRPGAYVIPSGDRIEDALELLFDTYAAKDCDCTSEVQFFSHGSPGNAWSIAKTNDELTIKDFNIPGLERFGDGPTSMPGYREWHDGLTARQRRLVLLRRTLCGPDTEIYYRSCEAFQGKEGQAFAKASAEFWRSEVVGHTKVIGLTQPGKKTIGPCEEPGWPESEGAGAPTAKKKNIDANVKPAKD